MGTRVWMPTVVVVVGMGVGLSLARADEPAPAAPPAGPAGAKVPVYSAGAELVLLDIIVRDKKGKPVSDLAPEELEVYEDGVRQTVQSFRRVSAQPIGETKAEVPAALDSTARAPAIDPSKAIGNRLVTLVFDRLGPDARRLALDAATDLVKTLMPAGTKVAVVRLDSSASLVQPETSDLDLARQAIQRATAGVSGANALQPASGGQGTDADAASGTASAAGARPDAAAVNRGKLKGLEGGSLGEERLSQSFMVDKLYSLANLVEQFRPEGGRKALVFFSEGMTVPPGLDHVFRSVVSAANRANVSIYAMDVRGLDLDSQLSAARSALEETGRVSESQRLAGTSGNPMTQRQMGQDDMALTSLGANAAATLGELSSSTGGLLVTETNNFSKGIAQIGTDLREYYEAAYAPSTARDPGQFHKIDVRVTRKGARVRSRSGYFTSSPAGARGVTPTIGAALTVLSQPSLPHDMEALSGILRFGAVGNTVEHLLRVEVPLAGIALDEDTAAGRFRGQLTIFGQVKDESGAVVDAFGQEYPMQGALTEVEGLHAASVTFSRRLRLAPGAYTLEWIARDAGANRATAERQALAVKLPPGRLSMSSLVIVGGIGASNSSTDPSDPLLVGDSLIAPNLGRAIVPSAGRETLPLYCVVYSPPGVQGTPTATIELSRDGTVLARGGGPLPRPDARGWIQHLSTIPLRKLTPGEYRVRVIVTQGEGRIEEAATLRIGP
jgi:VWFA-related protein